MKERPILFSAQMVRAILDGRKSQTRRVVNERAKRDDCQWVCPYGQPGDRLWVREAFLQSALGQYFYRADGKCDAEHWRPSIHMPRHASRLTLEVTGVRVERVQRISGDDAVKEGTYSPAHWMPAEKIGAFQMLWDSINGKRPGCAWADNPWVWVVEFKVVTP